jgi:chromate transporter
LLAAALYDPVWTTAIHAPVDFILALAAFALLLYARLSPVWVVTLAAGAGWLMSR